MPNEETESIRKAHLRLVELRLSLIKQIARTTPSMDSVSDLVQVNTAIEIVKKLEGNRNS